jgi:chromosome segregation ATPase
MEDSLFSARLNNHDLLINSLVKSQTKLEENLTVLTDILKQVVDQQQKHDAAMEALNQRLDAQEGQIKILMEQFMSGFNMETLRNMMEDINARFDQVNTRLDQVVERLDAHDAKFAENDRKFDRIFQEIADIRQEMGDIRQEVGDIRQEVGDIRQEIRDIRSILESIQTKLDQ